MFRKFEFINFYYFSISSIRASQGEDVHRPAQSGDEGILNILFEHFKQKV